MQPAELDITAAAATTRDIYAIGLRPFAAVCDTMELVCLLFVPKHLLAIWVSYFHFKELPNVLAPSKLPGWADVSIAIDGDPAPSDQKYRYSR